MLTCPCRNLDVTPTLPLHLHPHHSLRSRSALKMYLLCRPQPSLCLILSATYHAYARVVPSPHASDTAPPSLPSSLLTFPHPTAHNSNTPVAPSRYTSSASSHIPHPYTLAVSS
ncbi:hypothetical protein O181_010674 [Austropuccinia psidii MF-1]|uniref:Uncharacterized protein n=1 Tax=Austropuccinia psidii MF-1 TaxID=1389203 RepID=A0A9Q3BT43_9BASI|nr:hypothetical protein [Austropuccinia psidii MF-1]